jgi:DNA helicase-2/ATP-dependent DNA helicase PcrA
LDATDGEAETDLTSRIAAAAEAARRMEKADVTALAEARGWLVALATSDAVAGDGGRLLEAVSLSTEADFRDARADSVSLLTMHAAKGLEFPVVFVVGMEAGLVPFSWGTSFEENEQTAAEERRLFYVAMTRAKDRLFLTRAVERFWRGAVRTLQPSPFLREIATELITTDGVSGGRKHRRAQQLSLF